MKILVIGGSGLIGASAALHLQSLGHSVTISSRRPPAADSEVAHLPFLQGSYTDDSISEEQLSSFDALLFAAGNDPRHLPKGADTADYWEQTNTIAVPRFLERAKTAGVSKVVNIGSFYPWVAPELVAGNAYIQSRLAVDEAVKALNSPGFTTVSLNPPFILGALKGTKLGSFKRILQYARGEIPELPVFAPPGGVNFMTTRSLSEAVAGAFERGVGGTSYLVGDENLTFQDYLSAFFRAVGKPGDVPLVEQLHPLIGSYAGLGGTIFFEPDPEEVALLRYTRGDVTRAIGEIVAKYA